MPDTKKQDPDALAADGDQVVEGVEPPTEEELKQAREAEGQGDDGHG